LSIEYCPVGWINNGSKLKAGRHATILFPPFTCHVPGRDQWLAANDGLAGFEADTVRRDNVWSWFVVFQSETRIA
jgi:hypothetical protein